MKSAPVWNDEPVMCRCGEELVQTMEGPLPI